VVRNVAFNQILHFLRSPVETNHGVNPSARRPLGPFLEIYPAKASDFVLRFPIMNSGTKLSSAGLAISRAPVRSEFGGALACYDPGRFQHPAQPRNASRQNRCTDKNEVCCLIVDEYQPVSSNSHLITIPFVADGWPKATAVSVDEVRYC